MKTKKVQTTKNGIQITESSGVLDISGLRLDTSKLKVGVSINKRYCTWIKVVEVGLDRKFNHDELVGIECLLPNLDWVDHIGTTEPNHFDNLPSSTLFEVGEDFFRSDVGTWWSTREEDTEAQTFEEWKGWLEWILTENFRNQSRWTVTVCEDIGSVRLMVMGINSPDGSNGNPEGGDDVCLLEIREAQNLLDKAWLG